MDSNQQNLLEKRYQSDFHYTDKKDGIIEAIKSKEFLNENYNTLREGVCKSLCREFCRIWYKLEYVIIPRCSAPKEKNLRNCKLNINKGDLWGPLFFTLALSVFLSTGSFDEMSITISVVFSIVWIGAVFITFNAKFLGATISVYQTLCVLGYCLFPFVVGSFVITTFQHIIMNIFIKFGICVGVFFWSSTSSIAFMGDIVGPDRKGLAVYPIYLYYFTMGCLLCSL